MYVKYNDRTYYGPFVKARKFGLWPYMVAWISTGNRRNLNKFLLNLQLQDTNQIINKQINQEISPIFIKRKF